MRKAKEKNILNLINQNQDEIKRTGDVFDTNEGKTLRRSIDSAKPTLDFVQIKRVELAIRKAYLCRVDIKNMERSSLNLTHVCDEAICKEEGGLTALKGWIKSTFGQKSLSAS